MTDRRLPTNVRRRIVQLRFAGFGADSIADTLGMTSEEVLGEIAAAHDAVAQQIGRNFQPGDEVTRALQLYELIEQCGVRELLRLEADPGAKTIDIVRAMTAVREARDARVEALSSVKGLTVDDLSATAVRDRVEARMASPEGREELMRLARINPDDLVSDGERAWLGMRPRVRRTNDDNGENRREQAEQPAVDRADEPGGQGKGGA